MTKADIVEQIYERVGFSKKESAELVERVFHIMKETLATEIVPDKLNTDWEAVVKLEDRVVVRRNGTRDLSLIEPQIRPPFPPACNA